MDIMFRIFSAFGPAIMIPLVFGLLFKKFNARGTLWGVVAGSLTGFVLVLANFFLIQAYAGQMKTDSRLEFWLRSGWNSAATFLSVAATILGMWLGTASRPTPEEEKARSREFFEDLKKPFLFEEKAERPMSPFRIIGLTLIAFGLLVAAVSAVVLVGYHDSRAFAIDLVVALILAAIGILMGWGSKKETII
jgi:Na+/pantothenate symporter